MVNYTLNADQANGDKSIADLLEGGLQIRKMRLESADACRTRLLRSRKGLNRLTMRARCNKLMHNILNES